LGGYSQIRAEFTLLKKAVSEKYDYYHLLQGSDFPIKTQSDIDEFFEKNKGMEFIEYAPQDYEFAKWKCDYYHFLVDNRFYRKSKFLKAISHGLVQMQKILKIKRDDELLYHGSALFSITHQCAQYVLEHEKTIQQKYKTCIAADEVFLQTLIMNSPYKDYIYHFENSDGNLRYIDWEHKKGSSPKTFEIGDFEKLMSLPEQYCFARKFSDSNIDIVKKIMKVLER
jgi:hypothetical protein